MSVSQPFAAVAHSIKEWAVNQGGSYRSIDPEFDNLAELAVNAIRFEPGAEIACLMRSVEEVRQQCESHQNPLAVAHLEMATRILAAAARRRLPLPDGLTDSDRLILSCLGAGPLSGRELAAATGLTVETVARRLPRLRAAALVDSWKDGRKTTNHRTPAGAAAVMAPRVAGLAPVPDSEPTVNQDLRKIVRKQHLVPG